ncbi:hypothetical protein Pint_01770 [Pistacia integerrima]|uniref:Uncharacterized protein n=1 Tax=Pistacia integerrima TaxID=434235 RepID=A0ACC0ZKA5_9ROSI|nr:hypothetical protein Pint_01770 [Pistacia integerrima]
MAKTKDVRAMSSPLTTRHEHKPSAKEEREKRNSLYTSPAIFCSFSRRDCSWFTLNFCNFDRILESIPSELLHQKKFHLIGSVENRNVGFVRIYVILMEDWSRFPLNCFKRRKSI